MFALFALAALARSYDADSPTFATAEGALVLVHTSVHADVEVGLAVVQVRQQYHNPFDHPIDATYLFPLPPDAAVRGMWLTCGGRRIEGDLVGRDEARARYQAAVADGRTAALLEQERPNLFQQSVGALCPGEDVTIELTYADPLVIEDGRRELVFPTTVGPRYRPGDVPEPPLTTLPAHTVDVEVAIDEGMSIASVWSDTHTIDVEDERGGRVIARTTPDDDRPNRDFQLAWTVAGDATRIGAVAVPPTGAADGYLGLTIEPALAEDLGPMPARELLFVLDESCSMQGEPFATSVAAVELALDRMRPDDTFDLVRFADTASALFPEPRQPTLANKQAARAWLRTFDGGGTEMTAGIVHSLDLPGDPARLRLVLMLTDGYIGGEDAVLDTVRAHLGRSRLFSLGVGSAVNRYLLDALAEEGRGDVTYQLPGTPVTETVDRFYDRIAHPALTDLAIDWGGLDVREVYPSTLPDLFAGQPVRVVARYRGSGAATIRLRGQAGAERFALSRPLDLAAAAATPSDALPVLWARRKIASLERTLRGDPALDQRITEVALAHHLVTSMTALVATETAPGTCAGQPGRAVSVPSQLPLGMSDGIGAFGTGSASFDGGLGPNGASGYGTGGGGYGVGVGVGAGHGSGSGAFGVKGEGGLGTVGGDPIILGALDRTLIEKVITDHIDAVRYCYQRALPRSPELAGKLVVRFTIGADGAVSAAEARSSTLGEASVEDCVVGRIRKLVFPPPAGGGSVVVSYPFLFAPE